MYTESVLMFENCKSEYFSDFCRTTLRQSKGVFYSPSKQLVICSPDGFTAGLIYMSECPVMLLYIIRLLNTKIKYTLPAWSNSIELIFILFDWKLGGLMVKLGFHLLLLPSLAVIKLKLSKTTEASIKLTEKLDSA